MAVDWSILLFGILAFIAFIIKSALEQATNSDKLKLAFEQEASLTQKSYKKMELTLQSLEDKVKPIEDLLRNLSTITPETDSLKEQIQSLLRDFIELKSRSDLCSSISKWLSDKDRLKAMTMQASDFALTKLPLPKLLFPGSRTKKIKEVKQNIYDCLTWIRHSFTAGGYLTTDSLKSRLKRSNYERITEALKFLIGQQSLLKDLSENARLELDIYFLELIQRIDRWQQERS